MTDPALPDPLQRKLDTLPDGPGVYLWKDAAGDVLYVGKAKRLKSRVRSYFATDFPDSPKNRLLQRLIADVETIVVRSEAHGSYLKRSPHFAKGQLFPKLIVEFFLKTKDNNWKGKPLLADDPLMLHREGASQI